MATVEQYETDALGARWHRVLLDPISMVAMLAPWQLARDACADAIARGELDDADAPTMLHTLRDRIVTEATRLARASHTWWSDPAGDASPVAPAPDQYDRVRSSTVKKRTNSGRTVDDVKRHGRAYVVGSLAPIGPNRGASMSVARIVAALETAPRTTNGRDAIAIGRLTDAIYDLPRLVGADTVAYEEAISHELRGASPAMKRHAPRLALEGITPRGAERIASAPRSSAVDWSGADTPDWSPATVRALLAPCADADHAWRGHKRYVRPDTDKKKRESKARPVDETVDANGRIAETVEYLATTAPAGYRAHVRDGDMLLTFSRGNSKRTRFVVTGSGWQVDGRTAHGIAIATARAIGADHDPAPRPLVTVRGVIRSASPATS